MAAIHLFYIWRRVNGKPPTQTILEALILRFMRNLFLFLCLFYLELIEIKARKGRKKNTNMIWLKNGEELDSGVRIAFIFMVLVLLLCTGNLLYLVWCMKSMDQNLLAKFIAQEQKVYHTMKSVTSLDTWATDIFLLLDLLSGVTGLAYFWKGSGGFMPSVYESTPFFPLHPIGFSHSLECAIGFFICGLLLTVGLWILHSALHPSSHKPPLVNGLITKQK